VPSHWKLLLLILGLVVVGLFLVDDYGASFDEPFNVDYARWAIDQFRGIDVFQRMDDRGSNKGPIYFVGYTILGDVLAAAVPQWEAPDARHFVNFLMFAMAVGCLYALGLRFVAPTSALLAAGLFATQPLLFGHAFINQKDIPFMAMFLLTVVVGLKASDGRPVGPEDERPNESRSLWKEARSEWQGHSKLNGILYAGLFLTVLLVEVLLFQDALVLPMLEGIVINAYSGQAGPVVGWLFERFAASGKSVPVHAYLRELGLALVQARVLSIPLAGLAILAILSSAFSRTFQRLKTMWRGRELRFLASGALLGATISMREIGGLAGILITLYFISQAGRRALPWLAYFWAVTLIVMYLVWPALWGDPVGPLLDRFSDAARFPLAHTTLYAGELVSSYDLPWHYVPWLTTIQLTEGLLLSLLLAVIGIAVNGLGMRRIWLVGIVLWIGVPVLILVGFGVAIYDNIRHFLFALPPLFLLAGIGIEHILLWTRGSMLGWVLAAGLSLPGVLAILVGHPFDYVYYNSLVGGVRGAAGRYEMDYWCTSLRDAVGYLNGYAAPGSLVAVGGAGHVARIYARDDLVIEGVKSLELDPDYGLACGDLIPDPQYFRGMKIVHEVTSRGIVLAQVLEAEE
jgi:hypothetical protein